MERSVQRLALDVPQGEIDRAERVQPLLAGRVEGIHVGALPDHLGVEGVPADHASRDVTHGVRRATLPDPGDPGIRVDEDDHVALGKGLRAVPVVVEGIEDANPGDGRGREAGLRARQCWRGLCLLRCRRRGRLRTRRKGPDGSGERFGKTPAAQIHTVRLLAGPGIRSGAADHFAASVAVSPLMGRSFSSRNRAQKSVAPPAFTIAARIMFAPLCNVSRFDTPSSITVWRSL